MNFGNIFSSTKSSQTLSNQINVLCLSSKHKSKHPKQAKENKTNKQGQKPRVCFVLVSSFQTSGPPWSMAHIPHRPCVPPLKKADFFPLCYQESVIKGFLARGRTLYLFPFSKLGFCMVWTSTCHPCAITISEFICVSVMFCLESCFFGVAHYFWLIQSFCPFT